MLVLTRKRAQTIKIGEDVYITILENSRGWVKVGIQAPLSVRIMRAELENDAQAPSVKPPSVNADLPELESFAFESFDDGFNADIANLEDQASLCMAR